MSIPVVPDAPKYYVEQRLSVETDSNQSDEELFQGYADLDSYDKQEFSQPAISSKFAGVIAILFGTIGLHNFIIGRYWVGLIQFLITVLSFGTLSFISTWWGIVEGIFLLAGKNLPNQRMK